jgi:uncharacterized protein
MRSIHQAVMATALALCLNPAAWAQEAPASPSSPAKKALVAKILLLQQGGIENMARGLVEQPAAQMSQQVSAILRTRVPAEQREGLAREIEADVRKYLEDTFMRERALKLAPSTIGAALEEKLSESELKQVVALLESPANKKYQALLGDTLRSFSEKLVGDTRATVQPKVQALNQTIGNRLAPFSGAAAPASAPK